MEALVPRTKLNRKKGWPPVTPMAWDKTIELHERAKSHSPHSIVSFSGGKESIACWLTALEFFSPSQIHAFFLYLVPGLGHTVPAPGLLIDALDSWVAFIESNGESGAVPGVIGGIPPQP